MAQQLEKEQWLEKVKSYSIAKYGYSEKTAVEYRNCGGWDGYYADGYTPEEAVDEDMSYQAQN